MSLFDTLNNDEPEPTPTPAPAVEQPRITATAGGEEEADPHASTKENAVLSENQQDHLRKMRKQLTQKLEGLNTAHQAVVGEFQAHIPNHLHVGDWESISSMAHAAWGTSTKLRQGLVIFGGWHRQPPAGVLGPGNLEVVPYKIYNLLNIHNQYAEARNRAKDLKLFGEWMRGHPLLFKPLLRNNKWHVDEVCEVAISKMMSLEDQIKTQLLFMKNKAFLFHPTAKDPSAGWSDFIFFCLCYQNLSRFLRDDFGPYFFLTKIPSGKS